MIAMILGRCETELNYGGSALRTEPSLIWQGDDNMASFVFFLIAKGISCRQPHAIRLLLSIYTIGVLSAGLYHFV